jgi:hypothetical protein
LDVSPAFNKEKRCGLVSGCEQVSDQRKSEDPRKVDEARIAFETTFLSGAASRWR